MESSSPRSIKTLRTITVLEMAMMQPRRMPAPRERPKRLPMPPVRAIASRIWRAPPMTATL
ncbi:hypothetical protein D3C72_1452560 [compost metagenome]